MIKICKLFINKNFFKRYLFFIIIIIFSLFFQKTSAAYYEFTWVPKGPVGVPPLAELKYIASDFTSTNLLAAVNGGRLYRSTDSGDTWGEVQPAGNTNQNWSSTDVSGDGSIMLAAVNGGRLYRSTDSGDTWGEVQPAGNTNVNWFSVSVSGNDGSTMLAAVNGGRLYQSTDSGDTWSEEQPAGSTNQNWSSTDVSGDGSAILASVNGGRVYTEDTAELSWQEVTIVDNADHQWTKVTISNDGQTFFAAISLGRLYYSTNIGSSWNETQPAGNANQNWSDVAVNETGSLAWTANVTDELFYGQRSLPVPSAPDNFVVTNDANSLKNLSGVPVFRTEEVQNSGPSVFYRAHGNVQIGNKFYIGTRSTPGKIVVFNDPNDLTNYVSVTVPNTSNIDSLTYDSFHHRIYAAVQIVNSSNYTILSIDPDNIASYSTVVNDNSITGSGISGLTTDNTYIYGATYTNPIKLVKYRISDWTLVKSVDWIGDARYGHGAAIYTYSDRTEVYFSAVEGTQPVIKVDASDLSYDSFDLVTGITISDDIIFHHLDDSGGILYVPSEISDLAYALDTRDMSITSFIAPSSYGAFAANNNLYIVGIQGYIAKYPDFDINSPRFFDVTNDIFINESPNEFFASSNGRLFFTNWEAIPRKLTTTYLKEYEETTTLSTPATVTVTWEDDTPDVTFQLFISTDGINYVTLETDYADLSYTFDNLRSNTQYWLKVIAKNDSQLSSPTIFTFTTAPFNAQPLSSVPTVTFLNSTKDQISLQWAGDADQYFIKLGNVTYGWMSTNNFLFSNLRCDTEYLIFLKGKNSNGVETDYKNISARTSSCSSNGVLFNSVTSTIDFIINNGEPETDNRDLTITHSIQQAKISDFSIWVNEDSEHALLSTFVPKINFELPNREGLYKINIAYYASGKLVKIVSKSIIYKPNSRPVSLTTCRNDSLVKNILEKNFPVFNRLSGRFILATEDRGTIWYVSPNTGYRYEIKEASALCIFESSALGISNQNLAKIKTGQVPSSSLSQRLKGWILLQTEDKGKTWYVDPSRNRIQITPKTLVNIAKNYLIGATNKDLNTIPIYSYRK